MSQQLHECPNCESKTIRFWGKTSGRITLHDSWWLCNQCGLIFANPIKSSEEIKHFYATEFYEEKFIDPNRDVHKELFGWITSLILKWKQPKSFLEIGCGRGLFLKYFTSVHKPETIVGIEFDKSVTDSINLPVNSAVFYNDYYENIDFKVPFDVIFFWHVIEHVIDIHAFIKKINNDLASNGVAVIGTPAFGILNLIKAKIQKLLGKTVTVGTSSDHTFFFSKKVLSEILKSHGFEILYHKVYVDNVNEEMNFTKNKLKATILWGIGFVMKITGLPLFGKQVLVVRKR